jgi:hypothetical protein
MSNKDTDKDTNAYCLEIARTLLALFKAVNGHDAHTIEEVAAWALTPEGKAILGINKDPKTETINPS